MSLELTENKSSIDSVALNNLVFILYCRVIGQWLPTRRRSVGNQSLLIIYCGLAISWGAIGNVPDWRLVGDCILSVCLWLQKVGNVGCVIKSTHGAYVVVVQLRSYIKRYFYGFSATDASSGSGAVKAFLQGSSSPSPSPSPSSSLLIDNHKATLFKRSCRFSWA